jgi:site-specific DNA-cytosine methylase
MNVLSLFDGMSCGMIALERAGIRVDNYYSSEIDKYAIKVSKANYPQIKQLGDVAKWKEWDLPKIDLIIAGSPCQGFSFAGKQLAFDDSRSNLFFEFAECLRFNKIINPNIKFLLENVKMAKKNLDVISGTVGVEPKFINSSLVVPISRQRFYWSNIVISDIKHRAEKVSDFLGNTGEISATIGSSADRIFRKTEIFGALTATMFKGIRAAGRPIVAWPHCIGKHIDDLVKGDDYRGLTASEAERLQSVTEGYTNHVSNTQRLKMLGNGWTVDVIAHILKGML